MGTWVYFHHGIIGIKWPQMLLLGVMSEESHPGQGAAGVTDEPEDNSSTECRICERDDFKSVGGRRTHETVVHDVQTGRTVECEYCGESKVVNQSVYELSENFFCGNDCQHAWRREQTDETNYECPECGQQYKSHSGIKPHMEDCCPSELEPCPECGFYGLTMSGLRKHYTNSHDGSLTLVEIKCDTCGETTQKRHDAVNRYKKNYCSPDCKNRGLADRYKGPGSFRWKGGYKDYYGVNWRQQRRKARKRDDYRCQACGIHQDDHYRALDVHHIIPFRKFDSKEEANKLDNLVTMCRSCHELYEGVPVKPTLIDAD